MGGFGPIRPIGPGGQLGQLGRGGQLGRWDFLVGGRRGLFAETGEREEQEERGVAGRGCGDSSELASGGAEGRRTHGPCVPTIR